MNKFQEKEIIKEVEVVKTVKEIVYEKERERYLDLPHISNLHEDPQLSGKLHYWLEKNEVCWLGKWAADSNTDIDGKTKTNMDTDGIDSDGDGIDIGSDTDTDDIDIDKTKTNMKNINNVVL